MLSTKTVKKNYLRQLDHISFDKYSEYKSMVDQNEPLLPCQNEDVISFESIDTLELRQSIIPSSLKNLNPYLPKTNNSFKNDNSIKRNRSIYVEEAENIIQQGNTGIIREQLQQKNIDSILKKNVFDSFKGNLDKLNISEPLYELKSPAHKKSRNSSSLVNYFSFNNSR
jgi:hypothetical protein